MEGQGVLDVRRENGILQTYRDTNDTMDIHIILLSHRFLSLSPYSPISLYRPCPMSNVGEVGRMLRPTTPIPCPSKTALLYP